MEQYIQIDNYIYSPQKDFLGAGSFGKVYKAQNKTTKEIVALKIFDIKLFDNFLLDSLKNEINVMRQLKSQNVVRMYDVFQSGNETYLVIEYCPEGDLRRFLQKNQRRLSEEVALGVLRQLMSGFKELIENNYVHRDIKPENCLVKNNVHKVSDFGFATKVDITGRQLMKDCVGTPLYMAPQLLQRQSYTAKSDIWSIGMLYYEMLFGKTPWSCRDPNSYLMSIKSEPLKFNYDKPISEESKNFIKRCLTISEKDRMGWDEIFKHSLFMNKSLKVSAQKKIDPSARAVIRKLQKIVKFHNLDIRHIFQKFDRDNSQTLDIKEFDSLLRAIDPRISTQQVQILFESFNTNRDNNIDYQEFQKIFVETDFSDLNDQAEQIITELKDIIRANNIKLEDIFRNFDKDRQGNLDIKEFTQLIRKIANALKDDEIAVIFKKFDHNNDGNISFDEFRLTMGAGIEKTEENPVMVRAKQILDKMRAIIHNNKIDIAQVFRNFDRSRNHLLDLNESTAMFKVIDKNITQREANVLFRIFDENGDGELSFEEFRYKVLGK